MLSSSGRCCGGLMVLFMRGRERRRKNGWSLCLNILQRKRDSASSVVTAIVVSSSFGL